MNHSYKTCRNDSPLVSPVTLVLNVQLQKTPYLDNRIMIQRNSGREIYIILGEN